MIRRTGRASQIYRGGDQRRGDTLPAVALAYVEAGDDPHRDVVDPPGAPRAVERRQRLTRGHLAPPNRHLVAQRQQPGRRSPLDDAAGMRRYRPVQLVTVRDVLKDACEDGGQFLRARWSPCQGS